MSVILDPYTHSTVNKGDLINIENYEELKSNIENILRDFNTYDYKNPDDPDKSKHVKAIGLEQHALANATTAGFVDPSWIYKDVTEPTGESLQEYSDEIEYLYNRIQFDIYPELSIAIWNGEYRDELPHGWYFCDGKKVTLDNGEEFKTPDLRCCIPVAATLDREFLSIHTEFEEEDYNYPCLTFSSSYTFSMYTEDEVGGWDGIVEYSTSGNSWTEWDGTAISAKQNKSGKYVLYFRGIGNTRITSSSHGGNYYKWHINTSSLVSCSGNIETLLDYKKVANGEHPEMGDFCFAYMFEGAVGISATPNFGAMVLSKGCYKSMFEGCTNLYTIRGLPATTLAEECYEYMFYECRNLATLPELPATKMEKYCYASMFEYCSSIVLSETQTEEYKYEYRIPISGTGSTASYWNQYMFNGHISPSINRTYYVKNKAIASKPITTLTKDNTTRWYIVKAPIKIKPVDTVKLTVIQPESIRIATNYTTSRAAVLKELPDGYIETVDIPIGSKVIVSVINDETGRIEESKIIKAGPIAIGIIPTNQQITITEDSVIQMQEEVAHIRWKQPIIDKNGMFDIDNFAVKAYGSGSPEGDSYLMFDGTPGTYRYWKQPEGWLSPATIDIYSDTPICPDKFSIKLSSVDGEYPVQYINDLVFEVSNDTINWETLYEGSPDALEADINHIFDLTPTDKAYNYIRIKFIGGKENISNFVAIENIGLHATKDRVLEHQIITPDKVPEYDKNDYIIKDIEDKVEALSFLGTSPFSLQCLHPGWDGTIEYSYDLTNWVYWTGQEIFAAEDIFGEETYLYLRGSENSIISGNDTEVIDSNEVIPHNWTLNGDGIQCVGNIDYLLDYNKVNNNEEISRTEYCYYRLFSNNTGLLVGPDLPAITIPDSYYEGLYEGCTQLTSVGVLDAEILSNNSCKEMFAGCSNLEATPNFKFITLGKNACVSMFEGCSSISSIRGHLNAINLEDNCYNSMFKDCTNLRTGTPLPATVLTNNCYANMFSGCSMFGDDYDYTIELPATTIALGCYMSMFEGCISMLNAPVLPSLVMHDSCYYRMFAECSSLKVMPELPAHDLANHCYEEMFIETGIETLTNLTALTLADYCYKGMFKDCTAIMNPCEISAQTLGVSCCESMFEGCISLKSLPLLHSLQMVDSCYNYMFKDCTKICISQVETEDYPIGYRIPDVGTGLEIDDPEKNSRLGMFEGTSGTFTGLYPLNTTYYTGVEPVYLTFKSTAPFKMASYNGTSSTTVAKYWNGTIKYSKDKELWTVWNGELIESGPDNELYFRGTGNTHINTAVNWSRWYIEGNNVEAIGNIETLLDWTKVLNGEHPVMDDYCYCHMFRGCTSLTIAPELQANTLTEYCYYFMFSGCTSLKSALVISAKVLAKRCCYRMFDECSSLITVSDLYANKLEYSCYAYMFRKCTSLVTAPKILATTFSSTSEGSAAGAEGVCYAMFDSCSSLLYPPELPIKILVEACYSSMFSRCTSLTEAPELLATTLATDCYSGMFSGCSSLTTAPELPATTLARDCYFSMFENCTSLTTAPELPATILANWCYRSMLRGCTSLITAPELPATTLVTDCYSNMFYGCTSLTTAPNLPATTLATECYSGMFQDCTSLTTLPFIDAEVLPASCCASMFSGCTSIKLSATQTTEYNNLYVVYNSGTTTSGWNTNMFSGTGGTFTGNPSPNIIYYTPNTVTPEVPVRPTQYLTFSSSSPFQMASYDGTSGTTIAKYWNGKIYYSTDTRDWTEWDGSLISSGTDNKLYFAGSGNTYISSPSLGIYARWYINGSNVRCDGNIETLLDYQKVANSEHPTMGGSCYYGLFSECTAITTPPTLPATILTEACYSWMFKGCTSLTTSPQLPATTLAYHCYEYMFAYCTSLTTVPNLPATTLASSCYAYMFNGCTSLTTLPFIDVDSLPANCCSNMFSGCTSIKLSATQTTEYNNRYAVYNSGTTTSGWNTNMFSGTGGTFTGDPEPYAIYYTPNTVTPEVPEPIHPTNCLTFSSNSPFQMASYNSASGTTVAKYWNGIIEYSTNGIIWNTWDGSLITSGGDTIYGYTLYFRGNSNTHINTSSSYARWYISGSNVSCTGNIETLLDWETVKNGEHLEMDNYCYYYMFYDCTSLTSAPELPATALTNYCYRSMFQGCTSLTTVPQLPATTLTRECYYCMFYNCTSLITPPELPATTLADYCYYCMFYNCTSLTTVPQLPATTLAESCYRSMFQGCTSLTTVPQLPATTLTRECYYRMFYNCTSLKFSEIETSEYSKIFKIPSKSSQATVSGTWNNYMFNGTGGPFTGNPEINTVYYTNAIIKPEIPDQKLVFESSTSFTLASYNSTTSTTVAKYWNGTIEYKLPGGSWTTWTGSQLTSTLESGKYKIYLRGTGNTHINTSSNYARFAIAGSNVYCYGNIEALLDWVKVLNSEHPTMDAYCFSHLFYGCTPLLVYTDNSTDKKLTLPATSLSNYCYYYMFYGCTSITRAPDLPATILSQYCYAYMFYGCTSLTTAPTLPIITMVNDHCFAYMFYNCSSLLVAPALQTTSSATYCYYYMFSGCTSLTTAPQLPATTLQAYCYAYMFDRCTSLAEAPELPATTLATYCYQYMFKGCSKLKFSSSKTGIYQMEYRIPSTGTGTTASNWNAYMFNGTGGTFTSNPSINTTYYVPYPPFLTWRANGFTPINVSHKYWNGTLEYSQDKINWTTLTSGKTGIVINKVNEIYFRGTGNTHMCTSSTSSPLIYPLMEIHEELKTRVIGNIETLLDYQKVINGEHPTMDSYCYYKMFYGCTSLTTAPSLPSTTLATYCYRGMFYGCTSLTIPPALPATTLTSYCYNEMFRGCTSLTTAPQLPATTLAYRCYVYMFYGCTSLTTVPALPATTLAEYCYAYMFLKCTSLKFSTTQTGDYQKSYRIPSSGTGTTASNWYLSMFSGTGGTFTSDPEINTTYYTSNTIV